MEVISATEPVLHFALSVATTKETVNVSGAPEAAPTDSATPTTLVSRARSTQTPGADRSNSLAMITDFVPGAYVTHDQLHIRGGHQTSWLIDGVPVPNTNIASNLGPQFDPKDIDYLEVDRGSYGAELGDRTYGVFNVVPRTGFERNNEGELVLSAGNSLSDQRRPQLRQPHRALRLLCQRQRLTAAISASRRPFRRSFTTPKMATAAFGSLIFNVDPSNQLRFVTSLRKDYYQIPYDPFPNDIENNLVNGRLTGQYPSLYLRDGDHESDVLVNFSWVHTFNSKLLLTVSPFFHRNAANYAQLAQ